MLKRCTIIEDIRSFGPVLTLAHFDYTVGNIKTFYRAAICKCRSSDFGYTVGNVYFFKLVAFIEGVWTDRCYTVGDSYTL